MNNLFKRILFYHKAMNIAPYHFAPKEAENCPYMLLPHCPIWNCVFHFESLEPKALYVKTCNYKNIVR